MKQEDNLHFGKTYLIFYFMKSLSIKYFYFYFLAIHSMIKKKNTVASGPDKDYGDVDDIGCSFLNLTGKEVEEKKQNLLNNLHLNLTEIKSLERRTIRQSLNEIWNQERKFRLTASNFGRICALRPTTSRTNTLKYILYSGELVVQQLR